MISGGQWRVRMAQVDLTNVQINRYSAGSTVGPRLFLPQTDLLNMGSNYVYMHSLQYMNIALIRDHRYQASLLWLFSSGY